MDAFRNGALRSRTLRPMVLQLDLDFQKFELQAGVLQAYFRLSHQKFC